MSALQKIAGYLPPFAPGALALDRRRTRFVDDILRDHAHDVAVARDALATLRERDDITASTTLEQLTRVLLSTLRHATNDSLATRAAGVLDEVVRSERDEVMDLPGVPAWVKRLEMTLLDELNRRVGHYEGWADEVRAALWGLKHARICDLAAGSGGFFRHLAQHPWPECTLDLTSTDLEAEYVQQGQRLADRDGLAVKFEVRDALRLDRVGEHVDLYTCTQALHHLPVGIIVRMIDSATRAAPRGIVAIDVMRGAGFMLGAAIGTALVAPYFPVMVFDGVQSVRRGHTPSEFELLARLAGADEVSTRFHKPAHCVLRARRSG